MGACGIYPDAEATPPRQLEQEFIFDGLYENIFGINSRVFNVFRTSLPNNLGTDHKRFLRFLMTFHTCTYFGMSREEIRDEDDIVDHDLMSTAAYNAYWTAIGNANVLLI